MTPSWEMRSSAVLLILGLAAHAISHGDKHDGDSMSMGMKMEPAPAGGQDGSDLPPTYFNHPDDKVLIYAHIALMTLSWVFALPTGMTCPVRVRRSAC
ncbi:DUF2427 domain-containing protein [Candidatus Bathyarchaeota archaeon]|nr:DUF2427 domain-containing protein [Candidatus Bathyarchaeota archaeon]